MAKMSPEWYADTGLRPGELWVQRPNAQRRDYTVHRRLFCMFLRTSQMGAATAFPTNMDKPFSGNIQKPCSAGPGKLTAD
jgi:hypothetical protein